MTQGLRSSPRRRLYEPEAWQQSGGQNPDDQEESLDVPRIVIGTWEAVDER
jgi:hypothetical protein